MNIGRWHVGEAATICSQTIQRGLLSSQLQLHLPKIMALFCHKPTKLADLRVDTLVGGELRAHVGLRLFRRHARAVCRCRSSKPADRAGSCIFPGKLLLQGAKFAIQWSHFAWLLAAFRSKCPGLMCRILLALRCVCRRADRRVRCGNALAARTFELRHARSELLVECREVPFHLAALFRCLSLIRNRCSNPSPTRMLLSKELNLRLGHVQAPTMGFLEAIHQGLALLHSGVELA
mmetsp:Transcript_63241/g.137558  ORF Transcript_63241/g.137558 Transcript_63241/m.137558 type:complete len:235 (+) Transcript_63241:442-1146(+)